MYYYVVIERKDGTVEKLKFNKVYAEKIYRAAKSMKSTKNVF